MTVPPLRAGCVALRPGPPGGQEVRRRWPPLVYATSLALLLPLGTPGERLARSLPSQLGKAGFLPLTGAAWPDPCSFLDG